MTDQINWEAVESTGNSPASIFGHTATLLGKTKVVIFGGVIEVDKKVAMTNSLFLYSVYKNEWSKIERNE